MILSYHQLQCLFSEVVVESSGTFCVHIRLIDVAFLQLYQSYYAIIDQSHYFRAYAFLYHSHLSGLQLPYPFRLDKQLVGER